MSKGASYVRKVGEVRDSEARTASLAAWLLLSVFGICAQVGPRDASGGLTATTISQVPTASSWRIFGKPAHVSAIAMPKKDEKSSFNHAHRRLIMTLESATH